MKTLATVSLAVLIAPASAQQSETQIEPANEVAAILLAEPAADETAQDRSALLAALGVEHLDDLFAAAGEGKVPIKIGEHGNSKRALGEAQMQDLLAAFARLPRPTILVHLSEMAGEDATTSERLGGMRVLGEIAGNRELSLFLRIASPGEGVVRVERPVRNEFSAAIGRIIARDSQTLSALPVHLGQLHPSYFAPLIATIGERASEERLAALVALLGRKGEADPLLLVEAGRMGTRLMHPLEPAVIGGVRRYLDDSNPQLLTEAALALGKLEDADSVPRLIELLDHAHPNVRRRSYGALKQITGKKLGPFSDRWTEWYGELQTWWREEAPHELAKVEHGSAGEVSNLVLEFSKRRIFRHELAAPLAKALDREERDLVIMTCAALGHLGSSQSLAPLIETLENDDEKIREAAWHALKRITGREFGPNPKVWRLVYLNA